MKQKEILKYYSEQGKRTKISKDFAKGFGKTIDYIMQNVRNVYIHRGEIPHLRTNAPEEVGFETLKEAEKSIKKSNFTVAICRDFSMLTCALLREKGIPARCRCGFANYFLETSYEDHWVVEYYNKRENKWKLLDAQLLKKPENGEFFNGAVAWKLYREFNFASNNFGFSYFNDMGLHYIVGNLMRDFFSMLKDERKYYQKEKIMEKKYGLKKRDFELLDDISNAIIKEDLEGLQTINKEYFKGK